MRRPLLFTAAVVVFLPGAPIQGEPAAQSMEIGVNIRFAGQAHRQVPQMAAAGIEWVRADLAWSHVERARGEYDFALWDRLVEAFAPHGIRFLLVLGYGNALYDEGFPPGSEAARAAFAAFAGAAARHFRGRVAWEIWNEPNVPRFWAGGPDPAAYVALARTAAAAMRRADPTAWIVGPALGGHTFSRGYLEATFRLGLMRIVDAVSVHPYAASHPEAARPLYAEIRQLMRRYGGEPELPLVVSEWGYPALELGPDAQADYLARALAVNREAGIPLTIWYDWQEPVLPWDSFGLLDVKGRPKPAYQVLQALRATRRSRR